jgi:aminoglycoside/choline kinase family phosphotransferase
MTATAFKKTGYDSPPKNINHTKLEGDGSDRKWYRFFADSHSLIMSDHGRNTLSTRSEVGAFVKIGCYLYKKGIPVPEIYLYDTFSGTSIGLLGIFTSADLTPPSEIFLLSWMNAAHQL